MTLDNFTSEGSSESEPQHDKDESSGNKRRAESFTRDEFEEVLAETKHDWERKDYKWTKEWVYETKSENDTFVMRIFSSVDKRSNKSRPKDSDAIRLVVLHNEKEWPVMKEKRTNRIKTWSKNLKKKIRNVESRKDELNFCGECGGLMLIKKAKDDGDKFFGCSNYPDCTNTESLS